MNEIYKDTYQLSDYIESINISIHDYVLLTESPVLIHTGTFKKAKILLDELKTLLKDKSLEYMFISHLANGECAGLSLFLEAYPNMKVVCSHATEKELTEAGYKGQIVSKKAGDNISSNEYEFIFINYSSDMQEGILFMENKRGIFFETDLVFSPGDGRGKVEERAWKDEVESIGSERVNAEDLKKLKEELLKLKPKFIAKGHGFCLACKE